MANTRRQCWRAAAVGWTRLVHVIVAGAAVIAVHAGSVDLTEFMAANVSTLADEDGDHPDWFELRNTGSAAVNLAGWTATDDPTRPRRWTFPATNLAAGGRLVVFASGKDRRTPGRPLHASFQLNADGEFLGLYQPDGVLATSLGPGLPRQRPDVSYGLAGDTGNPGFLATATPGAPNVTNTIQFVADTRFSHDRGFYDSGFNLLITCATPGAAIYYTTNGSTPGSTNAASRLYSAPIPIARTTILRARAEKTGMRPSNADTHTYLFVSDILRQSPNGAPPPGWPVGPVNDQRMDYGMDSDIVTRAPWSATLTNDLRAIPTLSLVVAPKDLLDPATGIYVNAYGEGSEWERAASLELIGAKGADGFQLDAGVRIRGGFSRSGADPKHSFRIRCRDDYGTPRLRYPLFGPTGADSFDRFDLRTSQDGSYAFLGDSGGTFLNDPFVRDTLLATGQPGERGGWYHLYLNGQYWGLYNTCERPEANFAASYVGGDPGDYDVLKPDPTLNYTMRATDGDNAAWGRLWQACQAGFGTPAAYYRVQGRNADGTINPAYENLLDVTNLVDYLLTIIYTGNFDGPIFQDLNTGFINNFYAIRSRRNDHGFLFVAHDSELSLQDLYEDRTGTSTVGSSGPERMNPHYIATRLRASAEFKMLFADRVQKHFFNGGPMTVEAATARYSARTNELHQAITVESARWGDAQHPDSPITRDDWLSAVRDRLRNYFPYRTQVVLDQLRAQGLFPNLAAPSFYPEPGEVTPGTSLILSNAAGGLIYYTMDGSDPRAIGGGIAGSALAYDAPIVISRSRLIRARVRNGTTWSPLREGAYHLAQDLSPLRCTEIMYHPASDGVSDGDEFEFLELRNTGATILDLGGLQFDGISFAFTNGTRLAPGAFFLLVRNPGLFAQRYPSVSVQGVYTGKLANDGERLLLRTAAGAEVFRINYSDAPPWPATADGLGFSLVPAAAETNDPDSARAWRASSAPGGSPGTIDPASNIPGIVISEVLTHSVPPQLDAIELFNPTTGPVDVSGWYLSDDRSEPRKFRIPAGPPLAAGAYRVFTEAAFNTGPTAFALDSAGDDVYLFSSSSTGTNLTGYSHGARLRPCAAGVSLGRLVNSAGDEDFVALEAVTFGSVNADPQVGPVVINEIQYHPAPGDDAFVEILNISTASVALYDTAHPTNTWRLAGLDFSFPAGVTLSPGALALIVGTDPALFRSRYSVPADVAVFGPYAGALQNNGELLELQRPDAPDTNGVAYLAVDRVRYTDHAPWPVAADGGGPSLQRRMASAYGDEPTNWMARGLTPGRANRPTLGPLLTGEPVSQVVTPGEDVAFSVTAEGDGLIYQWYFNSQPLAGAQASMLVLPSVSPTNAGNYFAIVRNSDGAATSVVATLTVRCPFVLAEDSALVPSRGGTLWITLTGPGPCPWTVTDPPEWMTFPAGSAGAGGTVLQADVAPNPGQVRRSATFYIAGLPFRVEQSPPDTIPPKVQIITPTAGARVAEGAVTLHGVASDNRAIQRVEASVNTGEFVTASGAASWEASFLLAPGTNIFRARAVDLEGNVSPMVTRSVFRAVPSLLHLSQTGVGRMDGATNGQTLDVGRGYVLTAVPGSGQLFSNWSGGLTSTAPRLSFIMSPDLELAAHFVPNPFPGAAGRYYGLLRETDAVRHERAGAFTLTLTASGAYSAKVTVGGAAFRASGRLDLDGRASSVLVPAASPPLTLQWQVALDGSDRVTGTLSGGSWAAELKGDRAVYSTARPCPDAGRYTFLLPGQSATPLLPGGTSHGAITVNAAGVITCRGWLADRTPITHQSLLSKDGQWPFYQPVSAGRGSVVSWIQFRAAAEDDLRGDVTWTKPADEASPFYPGGYVLTGLLIGSRYVAPGPGERILDLTAGGVRLEGGASPGGERSGTFVLDAAGRVVSTGPDRLWLKFEPASGLFRGSWTAGESGGTALSFTGAVFQKLTNGAGSFYESTRSGAVTLEPLP